MITPPFTYDNAGMTLTETCESGGTKPQLTAYFDPTGQVWTIGFGHTGKDVVEGLVWTSEQCADALEGDILWASRVVNNLVTSQINQWQFDALVDFTFNEGAGNFAHSTLLALVNKSAFADAELEFRRWVFSGGKVLGGLVQRRGLEGKEFMHEWPQAVTA